MTIETGTAEINDTEIYYELAGSGKPLILLHAFSLDNRMWTDQFEFFAKYHKVIRYDLRGFGKSARPSKKVYSHHDDLKALTEFLDIEKANILGLSLGSMIAVDFATKYPDHSDALILASPMISGFQFSRPYLDEYRTIWRPPVDEDVEVTKDRWLHSSLLQSAIQMPSVKRQISEYIGDYSGWHFANVDPVDRSHAAILELHTINAPTLILVGDRDHPDIRRAANTLEQIPDANQFTLFDLGHISNMEGPDRFNEIVLEFLAQHSRILNGASR